MNKIRKNLKFKKRVDGATRPKKANLPVDADPGQMDSDPQGWGDWIEHSERSELPRESVPPEMNDAYAWQWEDDLPGKEKQVVALDVEMCSVMEGGISVHKAAIVSLLDQNKKYLDRVRVKRAPGSFELDWGTKFIAGIKSDRFLANGTPLSEIQAKIREHCKDKLILVAGSEEKELGTLGLGLNEFEVFNIQKLFRRPNNRPETIGLYRLAPIFLGRKIQVKGKPHCPTEDAQATLDLYLECYVKSDKCFESVTMEEFELN